MNDSSNNEKEKMKNISINLPDVYDDKIQWLIEKKIVVSRSEAIRTALREYLYNEYNFNLDLLDFFEKEG